MALCEHSAIVPSFVSACLYLSLYACICVCVRLNVAFSGISCVAYSLLVGVSKRLTPILFSKPIITSTCCLYGSPYASAHWFDGTHFHGKKKLSRAFARLTVRWLWFVSHFRATTNFRFNLLLCGTNNFSKAFISFGMLWIWQKKCNFLAKEFINLKRCAGFSVKFWNMNMKLWNMNTFTNVRDLFAKIQCRDPQQNPVITVSFGSSL